MPKFDPGTTTTDAPSAAFALNVPESWARFDLSDAPLMRSKRQALRQATTQAQRTTVNEVFRQARALNDAARRRGAVWAAGTATQYDDVMFFGYVMVFAVSFGPDVDTSLPTLTKQLTRQAGPGDPAAPDLPRSVGPVTLPQYGEAVRIVGTERVALTPKDSVDMLTMHTLVNVPRSDGARLLITCCSPNVPLADEVYLLFDAICGTFRFTSAAA